MTKRLGLLLCGFLLSGWICPGEVRNDLPHYSLEISGDVTNLCGPDHPDNCDVTQAVNVGKDNKDNKDKK